MLRPWGGADAGRDAGHDRRIGLPQRGAPAVDPRGGAVTDGELYERLWDAAAWNEQARAAYSAGEPACRNVQRAGRPGRFLR